MVNKFLFYVGNDWATQSHQVCLIDQNSKDGSSVGDARLLPSHPPSSNSARYNSFQGDVRTGPAGFRAVVQRFLAKEAGRRYQGAREVQAALEATQSGATFLTVERARGPTNLAAGRSQPYWQWWCWLEDFYGNISAEPAAQRGFGQWPYYHWRISRTIRSRNSLRMA